MSFVIICNSIISLSFIFVMTTEHLLFNCLYPFVYSRSSCASLVMDAVILVISQGLDISCKLVPKVSSVVCFKTFGISYYILIGWFSLEVSKHFNIRGDFVYYLLGCTCTSIYLPLSYPLNPCIAVAQSCLYLSYSKTYKYTFIVLSKYTGIC